jgi:hypothetical protein
MYVAPRPRPPYGPSQTQTRTPSRTAKLPMPSNPVYVASELVRFHRPRYDRTLKHHGSPTSKLIARHEGCFRCKSGVSPEPLQEMQPIQKDRQRKGSKKKRKPHSPKSKRLAFLFKSPASKQKQPAQAGQYKHRHRCPAQPLRGDAVDGRFPFVTRPKTNEIIRG